METKYYKENLRKTLNNIDDLAVKAKMELTELQKENSNIVRQLEEKMTSKSDKIVVGADDLIGRKITRIVQVNGRRSDYVGYLLMECEDGERVIIKGNKSGAYDQPVLTPEEMKDSGFYKEKEIQDRIKYIEGDKKRDEEDRIRRKKRELEELQKELKEAK